MANDALASDNTEYVIYIASTPEKAWAALTSSAFTTQYFFGRNVESDWRTGSPWLLRKPDSAVDVGGMVREERLTRRPKA